MSLPWHFRPMKGERVRLDLLRDDDLDALHAIQSDPEVCRYLLFEPRSREAVAARLAEDALSVRLEEKGDYIQPAIRDAEGLLLGTMYFRLASVDDLTGVIGWLLAPSAQGKGYAGEAAALVLDAAFGELGLHRVFAELDPHNDASVALCRRLGMRHEAHFVEHMMIKGEWSDTDVYGLLAREWAVR